MIDLAIGLVSLLFQMPAQFYTTLYTNSMEYIYISIFNSENFLVYSYNDGKWTHIAENNYMY